MAKEKKKKEKPEKIDGLSAKDLQKIRSAIRQVWHRSHPRKLCVERAKDSDGFPRCELCYATVPVVKIDHIIPVGDLLDGGIQRMFVSSEGLQGLCIKCHREKTNKETKARAQKSLEFLDLKSA